VKTAGDLLEEKGDEIWFVQPATSVFEGLRLMAQKNIGALLVLEKGELVGIFSERDYARKVILRGKSSRDLVIRDTMSSNVITVDSGESIDECMALMNEKRFRHLPVVDGRKLQGVISSTDVVRAIISEQRLIIDQLESHIRQRKQYADALKHREAELRSVLETVVDGILTFDEEGAIDSSNPAADRIFGYEPEEIVGMNIRELLHESSQESNCEKLSRMLSLENRGASESGREFLGKKKDDTTFPLHLAVSGRGHDQEIRYTAVVRDLTDFKRMQRTVLQAETLAAIGEMAASVAHEIKNPLAGIGGAIQILQESMDSDDSRRELMEEILAQVDRLDTTIRQLLMLSKPQIPHKQFFDLRSLLYSVIDRSRKQGLLPKLEFLFQGQERILAKVDPPLFEQVIWNLIENANDAMPQGGQVTLTLEQTAEADILKITDSGPGVPPHLVDKLFRPFFTTKTRGTGLGLSICKKIVDAHEGSIWIDSERRGGTEVVISLPRVT
jgi:PAS domain S-box-containing protein